MAESETNTAISVITDAMVDAGLLQEGSEPNSEQIATYMRRLTDLINVWQVEGIKLFLLQALPITLTASLGTYSLGPLGSVPMVKPFTGIQAYWQSAEGQRRPLTQLAWQEWNDLSQVLDNVGSMNSFFVDKQATLMNINVWPAPDATDALGTLYVLIRRKAPAVAMITDSTQFPQEWRIALRWGLADDICTGQPDVIMDRCSQKATYYKDILEGFDVEDTETRFAPDQRMSTPSRFR